MVTGESKDASSHTAARNKAAASRVPDPADLERVRRGHIASLSSSTIESSAGRVVFNVGAYDFLRTGDPSPETVNPNLWRHATLNAHHGLFEVIAGATYYEKVSSGVHRGSSRAATGWRQLIN